MEDCFSSSGRYYIRKAKAIRAVVQLFRPHALSDGDLVGVLKSLLDDNIFQSDYYAKEVFPELFPSAEEIPTQTQTVGFAAKLKMTQESKGSWLCHQYVSCCSHHFIMLSKILPGFIPVRTIRTSQYPVREGITRCIRQSCAYSPSTSLQHVAGSR